MSTNAYNAETLDREARALRAAGEIAAAQRAERDAADWRRRAEAEPVQLRADTVLDRHGRALHSNLNFGGRFGHSAIYHPVFNGTREQADHEVALRLDAMRDWYLRQGRPVEIVGRTYPNPHERPTADTDPGSCAWCFDEAAGGDQCPYHGERAQVER